MLLEAPNFFDADGYERMRTPAKPYNRRTDYSRVVAQLKGACKAYNYLGISPQNLIDPAELESVIVMPYYDKPLRAFVDPEVVAIAGRRVQWEGCANIRLAKKDGTKYTPGVKTCRPTKLVLSHMVEGRRVTTTYRDRRPNRSRNPSTVGIICHEIQHLHGLLIADIAYANFVKQRELFSEYWQTSPNLRKELRLIADSTSPLLLVREGDGYTIRFVSDFIETEPPPVSLDALYIDYHFRELSHLESLFVPREGEMLPITLHKWGRTLSSL